MIHKLMLSNDVNCCMMILAVNGYNGLSCVTIVRILLDILGKKIKRFIMDNGQIMLRNRLLIVKSG